MKVTFMIKDGGCEYGVINANMLGELASKIERDGSEIIHFTHRSIEVVGIMITGAQTGQRVIVLGSGEAEA